MAALADEVNSIIGYRECVRLISKQINLPLNVRAGFHQLLA